MSKTRMVLLAAAAAVMLSFAATPATAKAEEHWIISLVQREETTCREARDSVQRVFGYTVDSLLCMTRAGGGRIPYGNGASYVYNVYKNWAYWTRWMTGVSRT